LKEEAIDSILRRTGFEIGYEPVLREENE